jgi:hypothetical protein
MRESFGALAGAVRRLSLDRLDGHLFVFLSRRRRHWRALWYDDDRAWRPLIAQASRRRMAPDERAAAAPDATRE